MSFTLEVGRNASRFEKLSSVENGFAIRFKEASDIQDAISQVCSALKVFTLCQIIASIATEKPLLHCVLVLSIQETF